MHSAAKQNHAHSRTNKCISTSQCSAELFWLLQFSLRKLKDGGEPGKQIGKISFIDLAGSERGAGQQAGLHLTACSCFNAVPHELLVLP